MKDIISVVCASQYQPVNYIVGNMVNGLIVDRIKINTMRINGDLYEHFCGYDKNDDMLFSINCLAPCVVTYRKLTETIGE